MNYKAMIISRCKKLRAIKLFFTSKIQNSEVNRQMCCHLWNDWSSGLTQPAITWRQQLHIYVKNKKVSRCWIGAAVSLLQQTSNDVGMCLRSSTRMRVQKTMYVTFTHMDTYIHTQSQVYLHT